LCLHENNCLITITVTTSSITTKQGQSYKTCRGLAREYYVDHGMGLVDFWQHNNVTYRHTTKCVKVYVILSKQIYDII